MSIAMTCLFRLANKTYSLSLYYTPRFKHHKYITNIYYPFSNVFKSNFQ